MATQMPQIPAAVVAPPVAAAGEEADEGLGDALSKEVFSAYEARSLPSSLSEKAIPHPGDIAEPASLAAVPLPKTDFPLGFPDDVITSGKLSAMQLEATIQACTKHLSWLPSGERAAFFVGDGAGCGKGREISSVILDSYIRGRVKSVWISTSTDLYNDAVRDLRDIGCYIPVHNNLQSLDNATVTPTEGVMFVTYATLTSTYKGRPRLEQLINWVGGAAFDGVLVFDEAHKAKHYAAKESQGTKVAKAVVDLQARLPAARVMYCSATGVSEVGNMAYMSRLGLFGQGSAFPSFDDFLASLKKKGISFMELLAMELKGDGFYVARGLSFRSAEFLEIQVSLTHEQIEVYDAAAEAWNALRAALTEAVAACGDGGKDPFRPFWSAQQRFFKLLCVSMKVPAIVEEAKAALDAGCSVVIGLQSTGEAAADALNIVPGTNCGFISVCKEIMLQFVKNHFPTNRQPQQSSQYGQQPYSSAGFGDVDTPVDDSSIHGNGGGAMQAMHAVPPPPAAAAAAPVEVPEALSLKEKMLQRIEALNLPPNFLDELIDKLGGKQQVAEMTGRKARVVRDQKGRAVYEMRAKPDSSQMDSLNIDEKDAFMKGKKLIAIVSDAASTGISLHADQRVANQRRRVHLTIELPWSADKAIQQLGRSHRSNQTSAPIYKLVFTDLGGERRFAAAVARRLQSLGALTRGDRRAASGLDLGSLNYDTPLGRKALRRMYDAFVETSPLLPAGVKLESLLEGLPAEEVDKLSPKASGPDGRPTARELVEAIEDLHRELRNYVDMMGIGIAAPRNDTVAEDTASVAVTAVNAVTAASTSGANGGASKDAGDVRRFLNRLLAVPVRRQRLLFNYFQQMLDAEIRAAKAAGSYTEGVSDLPGQKITRDGAPMVLWTDPQTGLSTLVHTLKVDRGTSFAAATARLEHEARPNDRSSFYRSRRPLPGSGKHAVMLALQKPGTTSSFTIVRPNTGPSWFEMDADELFSKYYHISAEHAQPEWEESYDSSLTQCTHGPNCQAGPTCHVGRRLTDVTLLSGSVVRIWDTLERVLMRHEYELNKADRTMRIVRVEGMGETAELPLIGLRYPGHLLTEVLSILTAEALVKSGVGSNGAAAAAGMLLQQQLQPGQQQQQQLRVVEDVAPVVNKYLNKAFKKPTKTMMDFFKPAAAAAAKSGGGSNAGKPPLGGSSNGIKTSVAATSNAMPDKKNKKRPGGASALASAGGSGSGSAKLPAAKRQNSTSTMQSIKYEKVESEVVVLIDDEEEEEEDNSKAAGGAGREKVGTAAPGGGIIGANTTAMDATTGELPSSAVNMGTIQDAVNGDGSSALSMLCAMGFTKTQAEVALKVTSGEVERAAEWLLMNKS